MRREFGAWRYCGCVGQDAAAATCHGVSARKYGLWRERFQQTLVGGEAVEPESDSRLHGLLYPLLHRVDFLKSGNDTACGYVGQRVYAVGELCVGMPHGIEGEYGYYPFE